MTTPVSSVRSNIHEISPAEEQAQACLAEPAAPSKAKPATTQTAADPFERKLEPAVEALLACSIEITKAVVECGAVSVFAPPAAAVVCALEGAAAGKCVGEAYVDITMAKK